MKRKRKRTTTVKMKLTKIRTTTTTPMRMPIPHRAVMMNDSQQVLESTKQSLILDEKCMLTIVLLLQLD
jgi:hypothetical protein